MPMGELRGGAGRGGRRAAPRVKKGASTAGRNFGICMPILNPVSPFFFSRVSGWQRARGTKNSQVEVPLGVKSGILFQAAKLHFV